MHTQQMQPAFTQAIVQSQQAWHMAQQSASPLVQVKHTPILVSVHSHLHIENEQWHIIMPFIKHMQLHMVPAIILHMFCRVAAATSSSQVQVILNPSLHFSIFIVQRGTMHICMAPGAAMGMLPPETGAAIEPIGAIRLLSIIIMLAISLLPYAAKTSLVFPTHTTIGMRLVSATLLARPRHARFWSTRIHARARNRKSLPLLGSARYDWRVYDSRQVLQVILSQQLK
jgi:hypothetical protein